MDEALRNYICEMPVGAAVVSSLQRLFERDAYLLEVDANERAIAHRLAMYLQEHWPDADVDCEYNRDGVDPKRIAYPGQQPYDDDTDARTVFPDIIVHHRGQRRSNILVIEVKKDSSDIDPTVDLHKLQGYRQTLGYPFALFLELGTGRRTGEIRAQWVMSGAQP
jgi:hypothetical protein